MHAKNLNNSTGRWLITLLLTGAILAAFSSAMAATLADVKTGDTITLDFLGDKVDIKINDALTSSVEGEGFPKAVLAIWLGPKPPNEPLKKGILGK